MASAHDRTEARMDVEFPRDAAPTHPRLRLGAIAHVRDDGYVDRLRVGPGERADRASHAVPRGEVVEDGFVERNFLRLEPIGRMRDVLGARRSLRLVAGGGLGGCVARG